MQQRQRKQDGPDSWAQGQALNPLTVKALSRANQYFSVRDTWRQSRETLHATSPPLVNKVAKSILETRFLVDLSE